MLALRPLSVPVRHQKMNRPLAPTELHDIYAAVGAAVWHLQFLEDVLVTYLTMRLRLKRPVTPERAYAVLTNERRKTLGALLRDAKTARLVHSEIAEASQVLLEERPWLIHRSMHDYNDRLQTDEGREAFLSRLRTLTERAIQLKKRLYNDAGEWCAAQGLDVARAEAHIASTTGPGAPQGSFHIPERGAP